MGRKTWYSLGRAPKIERLNLDWVAMFEEKRGGLGFLCVTQHRPGIEAVFLFITGPFFITIYHPLLSSRRIPRLASDAIIKILFQ